MSDAHSRGPGHAARRRPGRRLRPEVSGLERRQLAAAAPLLLGMRPPPLFAPFMQDDGRQPTPREAIRQRFHAAFESRFFTGPGRYTDQAAQTLIIGGGGSSVFHKGDLQLAYYTPTDPAAPITGQAFLIDLNYGDTDNILRLDIVGDPHAVDRAGRLTHFTWTVSDGGGTFTDAAGEGTGEIRYRPNRMYNPGVISGDAGVVFRGQLAVSGLGNVFLSAFIRP